MGLTESLIAVLVLVFLVVWGKHAYRAWAKEKLRSNPPKRICFEVVLPHGIEDSRDVMARVFGQISGQCHAGPAEWRQGQGQVSAYYVAERPEDASPDENPELRFYFECDRRAAKSVKKALKNSFGGMAQIIEPAEHPLTRLATGVHPPKPAISK